MPYANGRCHRSYRHIEKYQPFTRAAGRISRARATWRGAAFKTSRFSKAIRTAHWRVAAAASRAHGISLPDAAGAGWLAADMAATFLAR